MILARKLVLLFIGSMTFSLLSAQQIPSNPTSYPVFTPFLINPAIVGSKDVNQLNLMLKANGSPGSQMVNYSSRIQNSKMVNDSPETLSFSNIGIGGYIFHDMLRNSRNIGAGVSAAYHIPLGVDKVSGISVGASFKEVYNALTEEGEAYTGGSNSMNPNADLGLYYYAARGFIGVSATNLLSAKADSILGPGEEAYIPSSQHLYGGYKILLNRKNAIVLEPSLLISINDFSFTGIDEHIVPYLKLYIQNFYLGTYYKNIDTLSLFFQYQLPRFYTGIFVEFPRKSMLNSEVLTIEISFGLKLGNTNQSPNTINPW